MTDSWMCTVTMSQLLWYLLWLFMPVQFYYLLQEQLKLFIQLLLGQSVRHSDTVCSIGQQQPWTLNTSQQKQISWIQYVHVNTKIELQSNRLALLQAKLNSELKQGPKYAYCYKQVAMGQAQNALAYFLKSIHLYDMMWCFQTWHCMSSSHGLCSAPQSTLLLNWSPHGK